MDSNEKRLQVIERFLIDKLGFNPNQATDPKVEGRKTELLQMFAASPRLTAGGIAILRDEFRDLSEADFNEILNARSAR